MSCKSCQSNNQGSFPTELNIHSRGRKGLDQPTVWAFPELVVCLDCGFSELSLSESELRLLAQNDPVRRGSSAAVNAPQRSAGAA